MSLERLFRPRSVALLGASPEPKKISGMMLEFLRRSGFSGAVYPVNPRYPSIAEWTCYPSVDALPHTPDVIVVAIPVAAALDALEMAGRRGVAFAVLMTGGFGEGRSGAAGRARNERLAEICRATGLRVVGPNIVGLVNFRDNLALTFADWYARDNGLRDGVAIVTHSGSVGGLIFSSLQLEAIGVDTWIGTGNEATLETADFIDFLADDPKLHTFICFMEGVVDGRKLMRAVAKARANGKTVVVLKAGRTPESARATLDHTCKSPSPGEVYAGIFRQLGVVMATSIAELIYIVKILKASRPQAATGAGARPRGQVGIIAASGGVCSLLADHIVHAGLGIPELSAGVQEELAKPIPEYGSTRNPVDVSADVIARREILTQTFAALARDDRVDTWVIFGRPIIDRYVEDLVGFAASSGKTVVACSGVPLTAEIEGRLRADGVPVLQDPELCMRALAAVQPAWRPATGAAAAAVDLPVRRRGGNVLDDKATERWLERHGIPWRSPGSGSSGARLALTIEMDADFGPIASLAVEGRPASEREVVALPATDEDIAEALAAAATGASELGQLLRLVTDTCAAYVADPSVAAVSMTLAASAGDRRIVEARVHASIPAARA